MNDGLKIVSLPGGYYGRSLNVIGWLKRIGGDEWLLIGACAIVRVQGPPKYDAMHTIAAAGPGRTHSVGEPSKTVEYIHRLVIRRAIAADETKWAKHCPKPADWNVDR